MNNLLFGLFLTVGGVVLMVLAMHWLWALAAYIVLNVGGFVFGMGVAELIWDDRR